MHFESIGDITDIEPIAVGSTSGKSRVCGSSTAVGAGANSKGLRSSVWPMGVYVAPSYTGMKLMGLGSGK